jgi:hypothetical protein
MFLRESALLVAGASLAACGSPVASPSQTTGNPEASRALLAFFSRPGENYHYGGRTHLQVGNTERVAEMIANTINVDVYRIRATNAYPDEYDATFERNVVEQQSNSRPGIADAVSCGCRV